MRESSKYERLLAFAGVLPAIRERIRRGMAQPGLPRAKVLATVVHLLDTTLIRVGNDDYARQNKSYGLTTLKNRHADVAGSEIRFRFVGKSGKQWSVAVKDRRVARIIKACQELPGQELLQYLDEDGCCKDVTSNDVNAYLKELTGEDITAKDFRTWAGTVLAATALRAQGGFESLAQAKRKMRAAIGEVAAQLGNTPAVCRKCYVHPDVIAAYLDGSLTLAMQAEVDGRSRKEQRAGLNSDETAVLALLHTRSKADRSALQSARAMARKPRRKRGSSASAAVA
jgi:DNA topoisomerase-1